MKSSNNGKTFVTPICYTYNTPSEGGKCRNEERKRVWDHRGMKVSAAVSLGGHLAFPNGIPSYQVSYDKI